MLTTNFAEAGGFIRSSPGEAAPDLQLHFVVAKLVDHGRKTVWGHGYSLHVCVLQPASRGSLRLASADPLALPLVDPAFFSDAQDLRRMVNGVRRAREILAQPALAALGALDETVLGTCAREAVDKCIAELESHVAVQASSPALLIAGGLRRHCLRNCRCNSRSSEQGIQRPLF